MKKVITFALGIVVISSPSFGSVQLDARFALRDLVLCVANASQKVVHSDAVESALALAIKEDSRFVWRADLFAIARQYLRDPRVNIPVGNSGGGNSSSFVQLAQVLAQRGADSALLVGVQYSKAKARVVMTLVTLPAMDKVHTSVRELDTLATVDAYRDAATQAWRELLSTLAFDATVLKREGYRVVIDRGEKTTIPDGKTLKVGTRWRAYTLEQTQQGLSLVEVGIIELKRVERTLSFGEVVVERRPHEITSLNKMRIGDGPVSTEVERPQTSPALLTALLFEPTDVGDPDGRSAGEVAGAARISPVSSRTQAGLRIDGFGTRLLWSATSFDGHSDSQSTWLVGPSVDGELWFYDNTFVSVDFRFGTGRFGTRPVRSTQLRAQVGYRFALKPLPGVPSIALKIGYGKNQLDVERSAGQLAPSSIGYRGAVLTGSFELPLTDRWLAGLEFSNMITASAQQQSTAGVRAVLDPSAWDFVLEIQYRWFNEFSAGVQAGFQSAAGRYSEQDAAPAQLSTGSQDSQSYGFGLKYFF